MMKKSALVLLFFGIIKSVSAQLPNGFGENGTMFRSSRAIGLTYVLLDASTLPKSTVVYKVTLKSSLFTQPQTDLTIEVYNLLFDQKDLAVFSVMPSLFSKDPVWKKINIDTLKSPLIKVNQLHEVMQKKFARYPDNGRYGLDRLKYFNYVLVLKKADGYYFSDTDCFTEFLTVTDSIATSKPTVFKLNLGAKMLSVAEYESSYRRKNGAYSSNYGHSDFQNSLEVKGGPRLNLSYIISDKGKKAYKFWLLDSWVQDRVSPERGMDRFVFEPGVGIIGAAYEFFMRNLSIYWYHAPEMPSIIIKGSAEDKKYYPITPYFQKSDPALYDYLTEYVLNYVSIEKL